MDGCFLSKLHRQWISTICTFIEKPTYFENTFLVWMKIIIYFSQGNIRKYCAYMGLPWWLRQWRICLQQRRPRFNPWARKIPRRREWQPTPVFLPGEFHGQRSLVGCSPWGHRIERDWAKCSLSFLLKAQGTKERRKANGIPWGPMACSHLHLDLVLFGGKLKSRSCSLHF